MNGVARVASLVALAMVAGAFAVASAATAGSGQAATTLTVCPSGCAFSEIAPAIAAASPGDKIQLAPGTYSGGFTIDKSLKLQGAGAASTTISGGGPVVTIGTFDASTEPTVAISGVTITGGVTHSSFLAVFGDNVLALGGGIEVPPAANFAEGATVTIANSVIKDNRAAPLTATDSGQPCPPDITITCINGDLPLAHAFGGGIDSWGALTLTNTTVSDNQVGGPVASAARGGGIYSEQGSLTLKGSTVTGNQAIASAPNGRFGEGGGVFAQSGMLTIDGSLISGNSASLTTAMPSPELDVSADAGGVLIGGDGSCASPSDCVQATIRTSTISGNSVAADNSLGDAVGNGGGIVNGGSLVLVASLVSTNHITSTVPAGLTACACAEAAGIVMAGVQLVSDTHITGNTAVVSSPNGTAAACCGGGSAANTTTIRDSLISGNQLTATTSTGSANARGAGFGNPFGAIVEIRGSTISDNSGIANGPSGVAQGGGIFTGTFFGDSPGQLSLIDSSVTHNALTASPAITVQGGGLFANGPLTLKGPAISGNVPDQCFGC